MLFDLSISAFAAIGLVFYLLYVLIHPEKF